MSCFWPKYKIFEQKKYKGVMFDGTEYWCEVWRKTDLCIQKWQEEFRKFSPEHVQKSKNLDFYRVLSSKVENLWAWNLQGSYVSWEWRLMQTLKRTWCVNSKLTWGIWRILTWALKNLKNLHFNGLLLTKGYVWGKKGAEEICLIALKIDVKFDGKLTCAWQFGKFSFTGWKIANFFNQIDQMQYENFILLWK